MTDEKNAQKLFGPGWQQVREHCVQHKIDFDPVVVAGGEKLDEFEKNIDMLLISFETKLKDSLPTDTMRERIWLVVTNAIGIGHTIEVQRRSLAMMLESGTIEGDIAQHVAQMFGDLSSVTNVFLGATLTQMCGEWMLGWTKEEVETRLVEPYNEIMLAKRQIFDYIGEVNMSLSREILAKMGSAAVAEVLSEAQAIASNEPSAAILPFPKLH